MLTNIAKAMTILNATGNTVQGEYPSDRVNQTRAMIIKWQAYIKDLTRDLTPNDLGSVYRECAHALNHGADNIRDEAHTTTVDR